MKLTPTDLTSSTKYRNFANTQAVDLVPGELLAISVIAPDGGLVTIIEVSLSKDLKFTVARHGPECEPHGCAPPLVYEQLTKPSEEPVMKAAAAESGLAGMGIFVMDEKGIRQVSLSDLFEAGASDSLDALFASKKGH